MSFGATTGTSATITLNDLLTRANELKASDLFIKAGSPPGFKRLGRVEQSDLPALSEEDSRRLAYEQMSQEQRTHFEREREMNLSFTVDGVARIRQNVYQQRNTVATTCRLISLEVPSLEDLKIDSKAIRGFSEVHNGLILVTGPTGSGKSTTLAAIINEINLNRSANIITIEDPIEYVHRDKKSIVSQREVGIDTVSFNEALRQILRQTPDVILIGELRDLDTLNVALQASETGHLVFATLHTSSAAETLDRISNMYAPHERTMLWLRLAVSLRGVVCQKLVRKADGSGRTVAMEIMVATPTISKQLEDGRSDDLYTAMRIDGQENYWGMQTMNQCLDRYFAEEVITEEEAIRHSGNVAELKQMLRRSSAEQEHLKAA
jgi:twitching motility protein PilT